VEAAERKPHYWEGKESHRGKLMGLKTDHRVPLSGLVPDIVQKRFDSRSRQVKGLIQKG